MDTYVSFSSGSSITESGLATNPPYGRIFLSEVAQYIGNTTENSHVATNNYMDNVSSGGNEYVWESAGPIPPRPIEQYAPVSLTKIAFAAKIVYTRRDSAYDQIYSTNPSSVSVPPDPIVPINMRLTVYISSNIMQHVILENPGLPGLTNITVDFNITDLNSKIFDRTKSDIYAYSSYQSFLNYQPEWCPVVVPLTPTFDSNDKSSFINVTKIIQNVPLNSVFPGDVVKYNLELLNPISTASSRPGWTHGIYIATTTAPVGYGNLMVSQVYSTVPPVKIHENKTFKYLTNLNSIDISGNQILNNTATKIPLSSSSLFLYAMRDANDVNLMKDKYKAGLDIQFEWFATTLPDDPTSFNLLKNYLKNDVNAVKTFTPPGKYSNTNQNRSFNSTPVEIVIQNITLFEVPTYCMQFSANKFENQQKTYLPLMRGQRVLVTGYNSSGQNTYRLKGYVKEIANVKRDASGNIISTKMGYPTVTTTFFAGGTTSTVVSEYNVTLNTLTDVVIASNTITKREEITFCSVPYNNIVINFTDLSSLCQGSNFFIRDQFQPEPIRVCDSLLSWDTSNVTNMQNMFLYSRFNSPINTWNVSKVRNMEAMFSISYAFNQNISNWDVSNVTNMKSMFTGTSFSQNISNWNVSNVTDMSYMFSDSSFNQPINTWNVSRVTNMQSMFLYDTVFNQPLSNWIVSNVTNMNEMLYYTIFNQNISNWNVSNVNISSWTNVESFYSHVSGTNMTPTNFPARFRSKFNI